MAASGSKVFYFVLKVVTRFRPKFLIVFFLLGAHDRAPEATSEVDLGGDAFGGGVVAARDVEVEFSVVVEICKLSAI